MPNVVKEMPQVKRPGRKPKYDLDKFFKQNKPVELVKGTKDEVEAGEADYNCTTRTMRHNLYRISGAQNIKLNTVESVTDDGKEIITFRVADKKDTKKKATTAKK